MIITAGSGDDCVSSRSTLLMAPRCSIVGAPDARNQEKAPNSECAAGSSLQDPEAPMVGQALPPRPPPRFQEPVKLKHRHDDDNTEGILVSKKQRSAVVVAPADGNVNSAPTGAPPSTLVVHEPSDNFGSHSAPAGRTASATKRRKKKPVRIKRSPIVAACLKMHTDLDDEIKSTETETSSEIQELISSTRCTPIKKAKVVGERKPTKRSDYTEQLLISLSSRLRCSGVTNVTPVLSKALTRADSRLFWSRLEFTSSEFKGSPLMSMLTPNEYTDVHTMDGLPVEALDRHGYSYDMWFGYVKLCNTAAYRLKKGWRKFLTRSGVREGALVEIGAFRGSDGRLVLILLNYTVDGWIPEETQTADNLLLLSDFRDGAKP